MSNATANLSDRVWFTPDSAPRNRMIVADVGMPWPCLAVWNEPSGMWCVTELECGLYEGRWNDWYISHTFLPAKALIGWCELPTLPGRAVSNGYACGRGSGCCQEAPEARRSPGIHGVAADD